jgi:hypothetical protein
MVQDYPWFEVVDGSDDLLQGDFIKNCPIVVPPSEMSDESDEVIEAHVHEYNVIVMSQSCDLAQGRLKLVLVCPIWPLSEFEKTSPYYRSRKGKESLRRGNLPGYHLLNKCEIDGSKTDHLVVDFRNVYGVPFDFLMNLVKKRDRRVRLLPPYREHLSQSFARFFMRVGLPVDIPPFA